MKDNIKFFESEGMRSAGEASSKEVRHGFYDADISEHKDDFMMEIESRQELREMGRDDFLPSNETTLKGFPDDRR